MSSEGNGRMINSSKDTCQDMDTSILMLYLIFKSKQATLC